MPENNTDSPSIARAILSGAANQLQHGTVCDDARLSLLVSRDAKRRRLQCANCLQFIELPVGDDYDLAWIEIGQEPMLDKILAMPAPAELGKYDGVCTHGVPMMGNCPMCAAETAGMKIPPPPVLNGQMRPPLFEGEGL